MKKYLFLVVTLSIVITIMIFGYAIYQTPKGDKVASTITIDYNPSIKLELNKYNEVINVEALNEDADFIIPDLKGKKMEDAINTICDKLIEKYGVKGDLFELIISSDGEIEASNVEEIIVNSFNEKEYDVKVIIPKITDEDIELAEKYNISPAKAAYINQNKKDVEFEELIDKPVKELEEFAINGIYCDSGYRLEGSLCIKEIGVEEPTIGDTCPEHYELINGMCYKRGGEFYDELSCLNGQELNNEKCVGKYYIDAKIKYDCSVGELGRKGDYFEYGIDDGDKMVCVDKSTGEKPTLRCYKQEHAIIDGKCAYGPKPLLPTPTGCEGSDVNYNGGCYDLNTDNQFSCPSGVYYDTDDMLCPDTLTYLEPSITYYCEDGDTLENNKCLSSKTNEPERNHKCSDGYTMYEDRMCIDYNTFTNTVDGDVCNYKDSYLKDGKCILQEIIEAKRS